jgi:hypothetical protein
MPTHHFRMGPVDDLGYTHSNQPGYLLIAVK